jgi:hypothetical protein
MTPHLGAILWAQYRALLNFRPREGRTGFALAALMAVGWYGLWAAMAVAVQAFVSSPLAGGSLSNILPRALMLMFIYWQLAPVMTASLGASLELKKLLVYPIPFRQLFTIEVLLRLSTSIEMMIVLAGLAIGLARNPAVPAWAAPAALVPFVAFNLFVSAGLRPWLERLLARVADQRQWNRLLLRAQRAQRLRTVEERRYQRRHRPCEGHPCRRRRLVSRRDALWHHQGT